MGPALTGLIFGGAFLALSLASRSMLRSPRHLFWGVVVGLAIVSGWVGTAWIAATGFEAEPIETHTFAAPIGDTIFYSMTASGNALSFSVGSVVGVLLGACLGSYSKGHFRWEACEDPRELRRQILGAAIMGPGRSLRWDAASAREFPPFPCWPTAPRSPSSRYLPGPRSAFGNLSPGLPRRSDLPCTSHRRIGAELRSTPARNSGHQPPGSTAETMRRTRNRAAFIIPVTLLP